MERAVEEAIQVCLQMWSDDDGPYAGEHYRLKETLCVPAHLGGRRPMVMIGGGGEGTDFAAIRKTVMFSRPLLEDVDGFMAEADAYARLGVAEIQVLPDRHPVEFTEQILTQVAPRLVSLP